MAMLSRWQDKKFWSIVGLTILWMGIAYAVGFIPSILFSEYNIHFAEVSFSRGYDLPTRILCLFSTILFPAIGQELFYRKNMIRFNSKLALTATTIASCILFGINDYLDLFGIVRSSLLGLSLAISYIKTKDIYVQITAHLMANLTMSLIF